MRIPCLVSLFWACGKEFYVNMLSVKWHCSDTGTRSVQRRWALRTAFEDKRGVCAGDPLWTKVCFWWKHSRCFSSPSIVLTLLASLICIGLPLTWLYVVIIPGLGKGVESAEHWQTVGSVSGTPRLQSPVPHACNTMAFGRLRQEDQKFRVAFGYIRNSRITWTTWDPDSKLGIARGSWPICVMYVLLLYLVIMTFVS